MNKNFSNINNSNNKFFANQKIIFIISLIIMSFSSFISVFAVNAYLYNANEVSYNNSSSGLSSSDVQGAINELYASSSNYSDLQSRIATLEARWGSVTSLNDWLVVEKMSLGTETNVSTGDFSVSYSITKSGYTPIGIVGWNYPRTYANAINLSGVRMDSSNVYFIGKATATATFTTTGTYVYVLYMKNL